MITKRNKMHHIKVTRNINTLEYPLWVPSTSIAKKGLYETDKYKICTINDSLPISADIDILNYVLSKAQTPRNNIAQFKSMYDLAKQLGYHLSSSTYRRIENSLSKWNNTTISFKNDSFYMAPKKYRTIENLHIIKKVTFGKPLVVEFDKDFMNINNEKFSTSLSVRMFQSLGTPYAKRLLEILFKSFRKGSDNGYTLKIQTLVDKLPISSTIRNSEIRKKMESSVKEINKLLKLGSAKKRFAVSRLNDKVLSFTQNRYVPGFISEDDIDEEYADDFSSTQNLMSDNFIDEEHADDFINNNFIDEEYAGVV
jgi:hypothetical protein